MVLTVIVICFCGIFFWVVFNRTMKQCDHETPVVQFSIANNTSSNAVSRIISSDIAEKIAETALTDREHIVEREHTRFRAELATWLSVFGLLTILVTLITPVCSLVFQQKEFERLQKLIDSQAASIDEIKAQQTEIKAQQEEIRKNQKDITQVAKDVEEAKGYVANVKNSTDANVQEEAETGLGETAHSNRQDSLRGSLNYFKDIWGRDNLEDKISAGIRLFYECNAQISKAIANEDYDGLKNCLNVMNNANAYLGMRNLEEFREIFMQRMQSIRPLKHSNEEVVNTLKRGGLNGPITGFYNRSLGLQGGFPG